MFSYYIFFSPSSSFFIRLAMLLLSLALLLFYSVVAVGGVAVLGDGERSEQGERRMDVGCFSYYSLQDDFNGAKYGTAIGYNCR